MRIITLDPSIRHELAEAIVSEWSASHNGSDRYYTDGKCIWCRNATEDRNPWPDDIATVVSVQYFIPDDLDLTYEIDWDEVTDYPQWLRSYRDEHQIKDSDWNQLTQEKREVGTINAASINRSETIDLIEQDMKKAAVRLAEDNLIDQLVIDEGQAIKPPRRVRG